MRAETSSTPSPPASSPTAAAGAAIELDRADPGVDARLIGQPARAPGADDIRQGDRPVPERRRIDAEGGAHGLGAEADAAQQRARGKERRRHPIGEADDLAHAGFEHQQVGAAVRQHPLHRADGDPLLPATAHDVAPGGRRSPFAIGVRFVQDALRISCEPVRMKGRVDIITLRVEDLEAATTYYTEGLGWKPVLVVPGEVTFIQMGHGQLLALFVASGFDADVGPEIQARIQCNLAHNVSSDDEVREAVASMVAAGATSSRSPSGRSGAATTGSCSTSPAVAGRSPTTPAGRSPTTAP